ncbi:hypothetical protein [Sediminibacillus massiliensis]|uniref:hypothetical protein n=1 Tax=Sediminibacillus massiliensis TaxID=1926277 RepID=UPI000988305D|nr:hypothetical protein [Sediminibacillus massiliensis]
MGKNNMDGQPKSGLEENEGIGIRTDLDSKHPFNTVDRFAGDSVNEHKELEKANEHFAAEEIKQVRDNS